MSRSASRLGRLLPIAATVCLAGAVTSARAQADCSTGGLVPNYNSPVIVANPASIHIVFWGWAGKGLSPSSAGWLWAALDKASPQYGILGTRWLGTIDQYWGFDEAPGSSQLALPTNPPNSSYAITVVDDETNPLPACCDVNQPDNFLAEANNAVAAGLVTLTSPDDITIIVYPPSYAFGNSGAYNIEGWHSYVAGAGNVIALSDPGQNEIEHELAETITDPEGRIGKPNWADANHCEIGDKCGGLQFNVQTRPQLNDPYSGPFQAQELWSNETQGCVYGRTNRVYEWGVGGNNQLFYQVVLADNLGSTPALGGWNQFGRVPTQLVGKPSATSSGPLRIDAFALDAAGSMWHGYSDNGGTTAYWEGNDSNFANPYVGALAFNPSNPVCWPDATSVGAGNQPVYAFMQNIWGGAPVLVKNTDDNGGWSGWVTVNSPSVPLSKISVAAFGASNANAGQFPQSYRTVMLAYIDMAHQLWIGSTTDSNTISWVGWNLGGIVPVDCDIALWAPGRVDVTIRTADGSLWQAVTQNGNWTAPPLYFAWDTGTSFNQPPGAIGLGDERLFIVDTRTNGGYSTPYGDFFDTTAATGFRLNNGGFVGGVDLSSW